MERAAPHVTGWPAEILGFDDRDMPDATAWERANSISAPIHATTLSRTNSRLKPSPSSFVSKCPVARLAPSFLRSHPPSGLGSRKYRLRAITSP